MSPARRVSIPVFGHLEDYMNVVLRDFFVDLDVFVTSAFEESMPLPCIVARQDRKTGSVNHYVTDNRFLMPALLSVDTITAGPDADFDGANLQEAARIAIHEAWFNQVVVPGVGYIAVIENATKPARVSDWATATSVVQYASLPKGAVRYESNYRLIMRPDHDQTNVDNQFVRHF